MGSQVGDRLMSSMLQKLSLSKEGSESEVFSKAQERRKKRTMEESPYLIFGRGVNGHLKLLELLIQVLFVFAIIAGIQIHIFKKYNPDYLKGKSVTLNRLISGMSLGVVEQSAPYCQHASLEIDQFRVTCDGNQKILKVIDMGIIQSESSICYYNKHKA